MQINEFPAIATVASGDLLLVQTASDNAYKSINAIALGGGGGNNNSFIQLSHTLSSMTNGGIATIGAWTTRPINTKDYDDTGAVVLDSTAFTFVLPNGTYFFEALSTFYSLGDTKLRLQNLTANTTIIQGINGWVNPSGTVALPLHISGKFAISTGQTLALQYFARNTSTASVYNYGGSVQDGTIEKYATINLWKVG